MTKQPDQPPDAVSLDELLTAEQAAKQVKSSRRMICRLAAEGRVPFAEQVGTRWTFTKASVEFLRKHYRPKQRQKNRLWAGEAARKLMLSEAAALDPACKARQESHIPQYWQRKQQAG